MIAPLAVGASLVVIVLVLTDVFELMLLPRQARSRLRFARPYFRGSWSAWRAAVRRLPGGRREGVLGIFGPLSMIFLLVLWTTMLVLAFGVLQWGVARGADAAHSVQEWLYMSGVTFFTLGYGDVVPRGGWGRLAAIVEAGTGFGLLAVIIGYLPVLYQLFSRREAQIIRLDVRAGSPPTATTLLVRCAEGERLPALEHQLAEWELWAAELLESHMSYPMMAFYRSQQEGESWLGALTCIMDVSALVLTGFRGVNTYQARITFGTARLTLMELARLFSPHRITPDGVDPHAERLPPAAFAHMRETLARAGLELIDADAERELAAFRQAYEPFAAALAEHLLLPLPRWEAEGEPLDNWQRSKGARAVKRLVESVEAEPR